MSEFNDNSSEENHRSETNSLAIENHTSTENSDDSSKQAASSVSLKTVSVSNRF